MKSMQEGNCVFICWFTDFISLLIVFIDGGAPSVTVDILNNITARRRQETCVI